MGILGGMTVGSGSDVVDCKAVWLLTGADAECAAIPSTPQVDTINIYVLIDLTQQATISCNRPKYWTALMR